MAHNSVIFIIESQINYILQLIQLVKHTHCHAIVVKDQVQDQYNAEVQSLLKGMVWQSGCVSWYQQDQGKNFTLWSTYTWEYGLKTKKLNPADYRLLNKTPGSRAA